MLENPFVIIMRTSMPICFVLCVCSVFSLSPYVTEAQNVVGNPENTLTSTTTTTTSTSTTTSTTTTTYPCEYNRVDAYWAEGVTSGAIDYLSRDSRAPSCILTMIQNAFYECASTVVNMIYRDDCVAWKIFGAAYYTASGQIMLPWPFGAQYSWAPFSSNTRIAQSGLLGRNSRLAFNYVDATSLLYIRQNSNGNCSSVSAASIPSSAQICYAGTYSWFNSPISLLWDDNTDIDADLKFTSFPLDPQRVFEWNVWKASAKAPLLVYDPKHTGQITSATQLFGNWTFGGKSMASLSGKGFDAISDREITARRWENGYEALAMLDWNHDGRISNEELEPLGLWFDENRDGVSQAGEVSRLDETGVITLYYLPNREEPETGSIWADKGFERIVDGKTILGRSVDWKSDVAPTKAELINKHLAAGLGCVRGASQVNNNIIASDNSSLVSTNIDSKVSSDLSKIKQNEVNLSGLWKWKSKDTKSEPEGIIGFKDMLDGVVSGHTYSTFGVNDKSAEFTHILSSAYLTGIKTVLKNGKIKIKFTIKPDETSILESEATFDPKTQKIVGKTLAKVSLGTKPIDLTYTWVASRMAAK